MKKGGGHDARPVLLNLGEPGGFDIAPWADRVRLIDAEYVGKWGLPVLVQVAAPLPCWFGPMDTSPGWETVRTWGFPTR
jgi:hypothetical protein